LVGFQPVVLWHEAQVALPMGMCVAGRPVAAVPLWQAAQFVAVVNKL
jgi:hypothetical protein